jgi:hypothetical protein
VAAQRIKEVSKRSALNYQLSLRCDAMPMLARVSWAGAERSLYTGVRSVRTLGLKQGSSSAGPPFMMKRMNVRRNGVHELAERVFRASSQADFLQPIVDGRGARWRRGGPRLHTRSLFRNAWLQ